MKLVNLLASIILMGGASAGLIGVHADPVAERPLAAVIEIQGADLAWIAPGPVEVTHGTEIGVGWVAWAGPDRLIRFRVDPGTDYVVTAGVGSDAPRVLSSHPLPVTREHRIEKAVRDLIDAQRRLQAEGANFFDISRWTQQITQEPDR